VTRPAKLSPSEQDNEVRWHPGLSRPGHVESYFLKCNLPSEAASPAEGPDYRAFWIKFTILQPSEDRDAPMGEVWAIAFDTHGGKHVALKDTFGRETWRIEPDVFYLRFGDSELRQGSTRGSVGDERRGRIAWDLSFEPRRFGVRQLPYAWMYEEKAAFPKNKLCTPQPDVRMKGFVEVNGSRVELEAVPGMQGHNWGRSHAPIWAWVHTNVLHGKGRAIFEAVSSRVQVGPVRTPWLSLAYLEYDGEPILLSGPRTLLFSKSRLEGLRWRLLATGPKHRLEADFSAPPEDFVGVNYHNPDGSLVHCLNSKIASGSVRFYRRGSGGFELVDTLTADHTAALEIAKRGDTHGVQIRIL
jgi:hypothetical protein